MLESAGVKGEVNEQDFAELLGEYLQPPACVYVTWLQCPVRLSRTKFRPVHGAVLGRYSFLRVGRTLEAALESLPGA